MLIKRILVFGFLINLSTVISVFSQSKSCFEGHLICSNEALVHEQFQERQDLFYSNPQINESCIDGLYYFGESTLLLQSKNNADLSFTISPISKIDDFDFLVLENTGSPYNCREWNLIRCSVAGPDLSILNSKCSGTTGISTTVTNLTDQIGCSDFEGEGFLKSISTTRGAFYKIIILNSTSYNGFRFAINSDELELVNLAENQSKNNTLYNFGSSELRGSCLYIDDRRSHSSAFLFPNPATGYINIHSKSNKIKRAIIFDARGGMLNEIIPSNESFFLKKNIFRLAQGLYFVKLFFDNNETDVIQFIKI